MEEQKIIDCQRTIMRLKLEKFIFLNLLMDYCSDVKGNVSIYGAGQLGKLVYRCFENKPISFLDSKSGLQDICETPVWRMKECTKEELGQCDTVIVTPIWAYDEICRDIKQICPSINVISLERLVEKL